MYLPQANILSALSGLQAAKSIRHLELSNVASRLHSGGNMCIRLSFAPLFIAEYPGSQVVYGSELGLPTASSALQCRIPETK